MNSTAALTEPAVPDLTTTTAPQKENAAWLERVLPLLVFLFCLAYLCVPLHYSSIEPDEGIVLQGAERILHGELPYRDFFTFYTPGSFYFLASWFRLFGDTFAVARFSIALTGASCSVLTYVLARRVCGRGISLLMAILATMVGAGFRFLVLHNWYSTLLCCLGLYFAVRFVESAKAKFLFLCATFLSWTFLFEQSKGVGLCLGILPGFLFLQLSGRIEVFKKRLLAIATSGFVLPILATFWYFGAHHGLGAMLRSWIWPLGHYTQANHVPYGYQNWSDASRAMLFENGPLWIRALKILAVSPDFLIPALPIFGMALLAYFATQVRRARNPLPSTNYYILVCSTTTGLLASVLASRADILHFIYLAPVLYVVLAWLIEAPHFSTLLWRRTRPYLILYVMSAFGLLGIAILLQAAGAHQSITTRRGVVVTGGQDTVIPYVQKHVPAGGEFLVYPYLPLYNYLTATHSPSAYDYFQPGMNTSEQGLEIVASLRVKRPESLLLEPWFSQKIADSWPGTALQAIALDPVADFVSQNYRVCQFLNSAAGWRFEYMVRRDLSCPMS